MNNAKSNSRRKKFASPFSRQSSQSKYSKNSTSTHDAELREISLVDLSHDGRGVGTLDNKTVFVQGGLPGERALVRIFHRKRRFDEATLVKLIQAAPERIAPACQYFGACGGCSLQHLSLENQLRYKQQHVIKSLQRIAGLQAQQVMLPITGPGWHYRRRARLSTSVEKKQNKIVLGFQQKGSNQVVSIDACETLAQPFSESILSLASLLNQLEAGSAITQIELFKADNVDCVVIRHNKSLSEIDKQHLRDFAERCDWQLYLQSHTDPTNLVVLTKLDTVPRVQLPNTNITFEVSPVDFVQVNSAVNTQMVMHAMESLALKNSDVVMDLFCGAGNFALPISQKVEKVIGLEDNEVLIGKATKNALDNSCRNVTFLKKNLASDEGLRKLITELGVNKILLDPPRSGAAGIIEALAHAKPEKLLYISCDPATMARDLGQFTRITKYRLKQLSLIDMFPQTAHLEVMALLERK